MSSRLTRCRQLHAAIWGLSENFAWKFSHIRPRAGLEGFLRNFAIVFAKGIGDFVKEVS